MSQSLDIEEQVTSVDNTATSFQNMGDVYNGPVNRQTVVQDNAVTYEVDKENLAGLEWLSKVLVGFLGERNAQVLMVLTGLTGGAATFSAVQSAANVPPMESYLFYAGVGLLAVAVVVFVALQYRRQSHCDACDADYSVEEAGQPTVREVRAGDGVRRTTTRSYRCRGCGHETIKKSHEVVEDDIDF